VLTSLLLMIDAYDLYGTVALPKRHSGDEIPDIYRPSAPAAACSSTRR
jgi:sucrose-phosphate synthase